jgi:hypothetical protein
LHLRTSWPDLRTVNGTHYADVLEGLYEHHIERLRDTAKQQAGEHLERTETVPAIDKSELAIAAPKRLRDSMHL